MTPKAMIPKGDKPARGHEGLSPETSQWLGRHLGGGSIPRRVTTVAKIGIITDHELERRDRRDRRLNNTKDGAQRHPDG